AARVEKSAARSEKSSARVRENRAALHESVMDYLHSGGDLLGRCRYSSALRMRLGRKLAGCANDPSLKRTHRSTAPEASVCGTFRAFTSQQEDPGVCLSGSCGLPAS